MGIGVLCYNQHTKHAKHEPVSLSLLEEEPKTLSIFVVRGMLRMGKELPKQNICAVYESTIDPQHNTMLQGLLGRTCGYYPPSLTIDVYLPKKFIENGLIEYCEVVKSNFSHTITKTQHIPKRLIIKEKENDNAHANIPHRVNYDAESYGICREGAELLREDFVTVHKELLDWWEAGVLAGGNYTLEQQYEIETYLKTAKKENLVIRSTHKKRKPKYYLDKRNSKHP